MDTRSAQAPRMTADSNLPRLRVESGSLYVEGISSTRAIRLFLEGVLGAQRIDDVWQLTPRARTLDELCILVSRWLVARGYAPELIGTVDVSVERDAERQRSFQRAREAAASFRDGE